MRQIDMPERDSSTPEQWRPVPGFPGYDVSDHGRVRSRLVAAPRRIAQERVAQVRSLYANGMRQCDIARQTGLQAMHVQKLCSGNAWKPREPKILRPWISMAGYEIVSLRHRGHTFKEFVHRLVLLAFVGPCPMDQEARHLDGNQRNNRLSNLAWGTRQENTDDRMRHGTVPKSERHWNCKLTDEQVREIRELVQQGYTQTNIAAQFGISQNHVSDIHNGRRRKTHLPELL